MTEKFKYLKIASFISIILVIIIVLSVLINPAKTNAGVEKIDKVVDEIKKEDENSIDVIVLGDSEAFRSITPLEMYNDYGFTTYVGASPSQTSYQAYEMLNTVLETQNPKLCILETNLFYRNFSINAVVVPKLEKKLTVFKYHNMWKGVIDPDYSYDNIASANYKGYRYDKSVKPSKKINYMDFTESEASISSNNRLYLDKILELCEQEDIKLLLVSAPSTKNWNYARHNGAEAFAEENDIPFIDFNLEESIKINWETDTFDRGDHLNYSGAHKVTQFLGKYLNDNYDLPDHRGDKTYESWETILNSYLKKIGQ